MHGANMKTVNVCLRWTHIICVFMNTAGVNHPKQENVRLITAVSLNLSPTNSPRIH